MWEMLYSKTTFEEASSHTYEKGDIFTCDFCEETFKFKSILKEHEWTHRNKGENSYTCEICKKSFARKDALRIHASDSHPPW